MRKIGFVALASVLLLIFLSPVFADVTLSGKLEYGGKNGEPLRVTGGSIVLTNEKDEIVAEGRIVQVGSYLAISAKDRITFAHNPSNGSIIFNGMQDPLEFVNVDFAEGGQWTVKSGKLLILIQSKGLTGSMAAGFESPIKVDLDASLVHASFIRLPKGKHVLFGYNIMALEEGGTVKFANGKIVERHNVQVEERK
jgi:hypothetical protein